LRRKRRKEIKLVEENIKVLKKLFLRVLFLWPKMA
jgi:hypothetical protein